MQIPASFPLNHLIKDRLVDNEEVSHGPLQELLFETLAPLVSPADSSVAAEISEKTEQSNR
jgi:hypothetical protein